MYSDKMMMMFFCCLLCRIYLMQRLHILTWLQAADDVVKTEQ